MAVRRYELDFLRMIAILCVIAVHFVSSFFTYAHIDKAQLGGAFSYAFIYSIGELGVPLFVMLSGFLMLDRNYDATYVKKFFRFNFVPLVVAYEIWIFAYYFLVNFDIVSSSHVQFRSVAAAAFFMGDTQNFLWYLVMIIGLYLGLPIVARILPALHTQLRFYGTVLLVVLVFFATVVPSASYMGAYFGSNLSIFSVINLNIFSTHVWGGSVWMLYFVVGYALKKGVVHKISSLWLLAIFALSLAGDIATKTFDLLHQGSVHVRYDFIFVVCASIALFELITRVSFVNRLQREKNFLTSISVASFGIYVTHLVAREGIIKIMEHIPVDVVSTNGVFLSVLYVFLVGLCLLLSWLFVKVL
ncbi:MAG: acyltransferase family protein, partial [Actinomycetaceae bacterium]|nr:acyltransferase family protein [Actinomycetaceae bacterium]